MSQVAELNDIRTPVHRGVKFNARMAFFLQRNEPFRFLEFVAIKEGESNPVPESVFDRGQVTVCPQFGRTSTVNIKNATFWETGQFEIIMVYESLVPVGLRGLLPRVSRVTSRVVVTEPEEGSDNDGKPREGDEDGGPSDA